MEYPPVKGYSVRVDCQIRNTLQFAQVSVRNGQIFGIYGHTGLGSLVSKSPVPDILDLCDVELDAVELCAPERIFTDGCNALQIAGHIGTSDKGLQTDGNTRRTIQRNILDIPAFFIIAERIGIDCVYSVDFCSIALTGSHCIRNIQIVIAAVAVTKACDLGRIILFVELVRVDSIVIFFCLRNNNIGDLFRRDAGSIESILMYRRFRFAVGCKLFQISAVR